MPGKDPSAYNVDEVCVFVAAIGLGTKAEAFRENAIDGVMLVDLEGDDFGELGLSSLQAKKVQKMVAFAKELASEGSSGGVSEEAEMKIKALEGTVAQLKNENEMLKNENAAMKMQLQEVQKAHTPSAPPPPKATTAPPPKSHPSNQQQRPGRPVVAGAAGGAARGALLGAVGGAIAGDAGKGAKMGAAMGATGGALNGLGARRRARLRGR